MFIMHNIITDEYSELDGKQAIDILHEAYPVINTNTEAKINLFSLLNDKTKSIPVQSGYLRKK